MGKSLQVLQKPCIRIMARAIYSYPFLSYTYTLWSHFLWSNGLVVKALDSQFRGPVFKTTGWLQGRSAFHPSEVNKMSTRNFWELSGKK